MLAGHTQTSYVLALHFDLLTAKSHTAVQRSSATSRTSGNKLSTGFVGTPYLNHVLTKAGRLDVAYRIAHATELAKLALRPGPRRNHHLGTLGRLDPRKGSRIPA